MGNDDVRRGSEDSVDSGSISASSDTLNTPLHTSLHTPLHTPLYHLYMEPVSGHVVLVRKDEKMFSVCGMTFVWSDFVKTASDVSITQSGHWPGLYVSSASGVRKASVSNAEHVILSDMNSCVLFGRSVLCKCSTYRISITYKQTMPRVLFRKGHSNWILKKYTVYAHLKGINWHQTESRPISNSYHVWRHSFL